MEMVRSTVQLEAGKVAQIKAMIANKEIASLTEAINIGMELLLKEKKREAFNKQMKMAKDDSEFMQRTLSAQAAFDGIDEGVTEQW